MANASSYDLLLISEEPVIKTPVLGKIGTLIAIVALTGCATPSVSPPPEKMSVPSVWRGKISPAETPIPTLEWWKTLMDTDLNQLISQALRNNPDLAISAARIQQAQAMLEITKAARRPNVTFGVEAQREKVHETQIRDTDGILTTIPPYRKKQFSTPLQANYEVDLLGRLALSSRISEIQWVATEFERQAVQKWVVYEVVTAYADLRLTEELLPHTKEAYALTSELLAAERARLTAGLIAQSLVRVAEDDLANRQEALIMLQRRHEIGLSRLALLLGRAPADLIWSSSGRSLVGPTFTGAIEVELPMLVLNQRSDLNAAWQRLLAATDETKRAQLERYPSLTLTGSSGYIAEAFRRWITGDALAWVIGAAINMPLLDGGRVKARVHSTDAERIEREMEYRKLVFQALQEVEVALTEIEETHTRLKIASTTFSRRQADISQSRHLVSQGVESQSTFLRAKAAIVEVKQTVIERQYSLLLAWASAQKALGR